MKYRRIAFCTALTIMLLTTLACAADVSIEGVASPEYYPSTGYESVYGSKYNYGGANIVDNLFSNLPFGMVSNTSTGVMEKVRLSGKTTATNTAAGKVGSLSNTTSVISVANQLTAYTDANGMKRSDGSIGTVKIPSLGISLKVWEGETDTSMAKGLGHYSSTSGWNGNVGVCGHNRGAKYVIGNIKNLKLGDTIQYTTLYGTRTYSVSFVGTIANTDWSYLQPTADNRITLTTCLADRPSYRICVQATETK